MKITSRLSDIPVSFKISVAPGFALLMLAVTAAGAIYTQNRSTLALERCLAQNALQVRLLGDQDAITAANGALYALMTRQAAGGAPADVQGSVTSVLAQLDGVKSDITALQAQVPGDRAAALGDVLKDLGLYRGGVAVVASMLGIDFNSAASFLQPFQANYVRMTKTLNVAAGQTMADSNALARANEAANQLAGQMLLVLVGATLLAVTFVSWIMIRVIGRTITDISAATEQLAAGRTDLDLARLKRRDDFAPIVRSLTVFQDNQIHIAQLRTEQEAGKQREEAARAAAEAARAAHSAEQEFVVHEIANGLERLAGGDLLFRLTMEFPAEYQKLWNNFNGAMGQLQETMQSIAASMQGVRDGAAELTAGSEDLSRRTENQASTLAETAAALNQITAAVGKTAHGAGEAHDVVAAARGDAQRSGIIVHDAVNAMTGIEESSNQINNIIGVIDEIAFQTNLLALNAGVEAARAGDAGRGFAVVATEVRALAQRSADAAKEIKGLISASGTRVSDGVTLVNETGTALGRIVAHVEKLSGLVSDIAASAKQQSSGLNEVNGAVAQMDAVTQQNAAMVEELTSANHALSGEAEVLARLVGQFKIETLALPPPAARRRAARRHEAVG
jgi:methyl-accepting chemotaxis protein